MVDFDAVFDGKDEPAPAPEPQPAEAPAPQPEQAEQPAMDAPPEAPPPAPEPAPQPEQDRMVPLTAMLDTRDKLKAAERRIAEFEAAQQRPQTATPDPYDDPDGFQAHVNAQLQQAEINTRLNTSNLIARQAHGDAVVQAAAEWAAERASQDPTFEQRMIAQPHPVDWLVRQHKQEADLAEYSKDPLAFARRILEASGQLPAPDAGAAVVAVPGQQSAPRPAAPPRSIASAPSTGSNRDVATGPLSAFGANFKA